MYIVINIWKLLRYLFVHAAFSINLRIFTNTPIFNLIPSEYEANSNDSHRTSLICALILAGNFVCSTKLLASLWKLIRNRSDLHFMLQHGGLLNIIKVFYTTFIFSLFLYLPEIDKSNYSTRLIIITIIGAGYNNNIKMMSLWIKNVTIIQWRFAPLIVNNHKSLFISWFIVFYHGNVICHFFLFFILSFMWSIIIFSFYWNYIIGYGSRLSTKHTNYCI